MKMPLNINTITPKKIVVLPCGTLVLIISLVASMWSETAESKIPRKPSASKHSWPVRTVDILCNLNEELCGEKCFDPTIHKCMETAQGWKRVCSISESTCGSICFARGDPSLACIDNRVCLTGQAVCSFQCYSPETHHCHKNNRLCPIGEVSCGRACHNPDDKSKKCYELANTSYLCKKDEEACEFGCFNPNIKKCSKEASRICGIDETVCGPRCTNIANDEICLDNKKICKKWQALCGNQCYTPTNGEVCRADNLVCKAEKSLCGTEACYDPAKGQTCHQDSGSSTVCESGLDYCRYNCYDKNKQNCLRPNANADYKKICLKGHAICNGRLKHNVFGYGCYDPTTQECITNDYGTVLCGKDQEACGTICYNPADISGNRCFPKAGVICKLNEDICGSVCYNKNIKKCFANVISQLQHRGPI